MITRHFGIPVTSPGAILRREVELGTLLGLETAEKTKHGELVPDKIIIELIEDWVRLHGAAGFVFDGFPRTIPQADAMQEAGVKLDYVIEIDVPDAAIVERMSGRRVHPASGRTYHVKFNPPKITGKDDITGEPLIQREDDREETVKNRLAVYHAQTEPLVTYYAEWEARGDPRAPRYRKVNGLGTVEGVRDACLAALRS
jgi:adenylate kinase